MSNHHANLSYPTVFNSSPQRLNRLSEHSSPTKDHIYHIRTNQISLFSLSPRKATNPEVNLKGIQRQRSRVESLNNLMKKCTDITFNNKSTKHINLHNKTANESIKRIKKSLNLNTSHNKFEEKTGKNLKKDAQEMSKHLNNITHNLKTGEKIWKFRSKAVPKSTEKLMRLVTQRLSSRRHLKTVFHCIK